MLKKMFLAALMLTGIAAFAGERAGLYLKVIGDRTAKIEFESDSDGVDCEANTYTRGENDVMRCALVDVEDDKPAEVEMEITSSVSGKGEILVRGFAEDSNDLAWVTITELVVNDKVIIDPNKKSKKKDARTHTKLKGGIKVEADQPIKVKATFVHSPKNDKED